MDWRQQFSSPSRMDTFAMYLTDSYWGRKDPDGNDMVFTDELFAAELLKKFEKTPQMKAGTAFHKILELSQYDTEILNLIGIDGELYKFDYQIPSDVDIQIPQLRETRISKNFNGITINGIVDAINGTTIWDHKFTEQIRIEKYLNSWQYRIYLWMTGLDNFIFNLFQGKVSLAYDLEIISNGKTFDPEIVSVAQPQEYNIRIDKFEALKLERYANMDAEVEDFYIYYWEVLEKLKPLIIEIGQKNNIIIKGLTNA